MYKISSKIVFLDLDGTILNDNNEILKSTEKGIKALKDKGIHVIISTGRSPQMFDWVLEKLDINSFIALNGQYAIFEGEEVYVNPMSKDILKEITDFAFYNNHAIAYCGKGTIKINAKKDYMALNSYNSLNVTYPFVDESFYENFEIFQCHLFCEKNREVDYVAKFPDYNFIRWHKYALDVIPKNASKANGIYHMLKKIGIKKENCYAFGDGLNDIEMLSFVGTGIAMENGCFEAKSAANFITSSNNNHGILKGLEKIGVL